MSSENVTKPAIRKSKLGQTCLDNLLSSSSSRLGRATYRRIRRRLIRSRNPAVTFDFEGRRLAVPLSHDLPYIRREFPIYSSNVGRLAAAVARKYPAATFIDVGANVGDTVAIIRRGTDRPILCIEGNPHFLPYLYSNCSGIAEVEIADVFLGEKSEVVQGKLETSKGTAVITQGKSEGEIRFQTLAEILRAHPRFAAHKLLKTDTDGYDLKIIRSAGEAIKAAKPVLFFEYDPYFVTKAGDESWPIFEQLRGLGYEQLAVYENNGDFLLSAPLTDAAILRDLHEFYSGRGGMRYCDVCAFHGEDSDLAAAFHDSEIEFFRALRTKGGR